MAEKCPVPFGRCVARRTYRWRPKRGHPRTIKVEIGTPVPVPGSDWGCRLRITGLRVAFDRGIFGIDAIQTLELALVLSGKLLSSSPEFHAGEIELWDRPLENVFEVGFPLPLHTLQSSLENLQGFLQRLRMKGSVNKEWQRGMRIVMREAAESLAAMDRAGSGHRHLIRGNRRS